MKAIHKKNNFSHIILSINSPENILNMSNGEVCTIETINYRTYRAEFGGLFCEKIFGPTHSYMCFCKSYKGIGYKGFICDMCGVVVEDKSVRRERWGHITLATPIANILFFKQIPSKIAVLLGLSFSAVNDIIYCDSYIIIDPGILEKEGYRKYDILSSVEYDDICSRLSSTGMYSKKGDGGVIIKTGGDAIYDLLKELDLDDLYVKLKEKLKTACEDRSSLVTRLKLVRSFIKSRDVIENKPEWMVLKVLPVMPADLRPLMIVDGTVTNVDLNDLYKHVIISNNRLKRLIEVNAPEVVLRNEKRKLQSAVDNLIDNSGNNTNNNERKLKSLSESIKGKDGRFRQNLLGKRVDYSGRSVIVINPKLRIFECGVPKGMAIELFRPMIICNLIKRGYVDNTSEADEMINNEDPKVFDVLEKIIKGYPVLLNRAPTLHRMNIQAFQPILIEGEAIELNPLVCSQFNADFDGDQMAIHIPLALSSRLEASTLLLAGNNILKTSDGTPCFMPIHDIILGLYYLTVERKDIEKPVRLLVFSSKEDVLIAMNCKKVNVHSFIKFFRKRKVKGEVVKEYIETTVGRVIFNSYLPTNWEFINESITKNNLKNIIQRYSNEKTNIEAVDFLDNIKALGFEYSYLSGLSFKLNDIFIPDNKSDIIDEAIKSINIINKKYFDGLISDKGRYNQVIDTWAKVSMSLSDKLISYYKNNKVGLNTIYMMLVSGARGSWEQLRQIAGMKGLISKSQKDTVDNSFYIIEYPITSNYKEGLDVFEYFISTYGGRKGMTDTALKTANAGHLTRKLVDTVQDVIITSDDCKTIRDYTISIYDFIGNNQDDFWGKYIKSLIGRISSRDVRDIKTGEIIIAKNEIICDEKAKLIYEMNIKEMYVRSILTCNNGDNVCSLCYGVNLASGTMSQKGDTVGIVAAQSIGEPGTQLTLNTFHVGGIASSTILESSKSSKIRGIVSINDYKYVIKNGKKVVISSFCKLSILHPITSFVLSQYSVPYGANIYVENDDKVEPGTLLFDWDPYFSTIYAQFDGKMIYENFEDNVVIKEELNTSSGKPEYIVFDIKNKNKSYVLLKGADKEMRINVSLKSKIYVKDGGAIKYGDVIMKSPKVLTQSTDITGGLPMVSELFEAKKKVNQSILSDIDGVVKIVSIDKNNIKLSVISDLDGYTCSYSVPLSTNLVIQDGDTIRHGCRFNSGDIELSDLLRTCGYFETCKYLIRELQSVYSLQGINVKEKHIAIIIKKMLSFVEIVDSGDSDFIVGEVVKRRDFVDVNKNMALKQFVVDNGDSTKYKVGELVDISEIFFENKQLESYNKKQVTFREAKPAKAKLVVRGISQVSLASDGFLSPASFQSTMSILTQSAISATVDDLTGIKANVIAGRKIKAGTGIYDFSKFNVRCE